MKKLTLLFLLVLPLVAQTTYTVSKTTALSGSAEVITVQQPSSSAMVVRFVSAYIDSTVACGFTIERDAANATSTTLTPVAANPLVSPAATTTGWSASNVGTGAVITRATVYANDFRVINLSNVFMNGNGPGKNLTLRTASCTGTVNIVITYTESTN